MGTSKSYGGPTDTSQLLPSWALNPEQGAPGNVGAPPAGDGAGGDAEGVPPSPGVPPGDDAGVDGVDDTPPAPGVQQAPGTERPWASAKGRLGRAVLAGGTRESFRSAARGYVRARGGSSGAARSSPAGRRATAALGGFLSGVAAEGIKPALERLGLTTVVGRDADQVFAAISNAIAPAGASLEEAVARRATNEVLQELYERFGVESDGLTRLEAMTVDDVREAIEASIGAYIYHRWLEELGERIEERSVSGVEAVRLERDMRIYVRDVVRLDLKKVDVVTMNWAGPVGTKLIEELYAQAYGVLGGSV